MNRPIVLGIGELLWDCFADRRVPGGAPANVAFHAQQLGLGGRVCSRVGEDQLGDELVAHLREHGLDISCIQRDGDHPTGTVGVDLSDPDRPVFEIHERVAWDFIAWTPEIDILTREAAAVCYGTLAQRSPVSRRTITRVLEEADGAVRVYDVNLRAPWYDRTSIQTSLERAQIVKLNADEMEFLAGAFDLAGDTPEAWARSLAARHAAEWVCVTRGEGGSLLVTRDETHVAPGVEVRVADAVGAGDAFTAALIYGWLNRWSPAAVGRLANEIGALVAGRPGAMPSLEAGFRSTIARVAETFGLHGAP